MTKNIYKGLNPDRVMSFDDIPGLKEAGWTQKAYEEAK
jgi:hypothetical protein